jgi:hypothetical protein
MEIACSNIFRDIFNETGHLSEERQRLNGMARFLVLLLLTDPYIRDSKRGRVSNVQSLRINARWQTVSASGSE